MQFQSLGREMPWRTKWQLIPEIPWTEELGGLQSKGPQRVRHDRATEHTHTHTGRWWRQRHRC